MKAVKLLLIAVIFGGVTVGVYARRGGGGRNSLLTHNVRELINQQKEAKRLQEASNFRNRQHDVVKRTWSTVNSIEKLLKDLSRQMGHFTAKELAESKSKLHESMAYLAAEDHATLKIAVLISKIEVLEEVLAVKDANGQLIPNTTIFDVILKALGTMNHEK